MAALELDDLAVFVRVVETGGFASAARELGAPTSTVSRAVARLEAKSGARLVHRTTRQVKATVEGRELYARVAPAVKTLREAARALEPAGRRPKGRLRVTAPAELCAGFLAEALVEFAERFPDVELDFALTNQHDDLVEKGFDVALRATAKLRDSTLVARKLGELRHALFASPSYVAQRGAPSSIDELAQHRCVVFRASELKRTWSLRTASGETAIEVRGKIGGDDFTFLRAMVVAGGGIGLLPEASCATDERAGRLVRVLPEVSARGATLYCVYPSRHQVPARVTAFRDFVAERFEAWGK